MAKETGLDKDTCLKKIKEHFETNPLSDDAAKFAQRYIEAAGIKEGLVFETNAENEAILRIPMDQPRTTLLHNIVNSKEDKPKYGAPTSLHLTPNENSNCFVLKITSKPDTAQIDFSLAEGCKFYAKPFEGDHKNKKTPLGYSYSADIPYGGGSTAIEGYSLAPKRTNYDRFSLTKHDGKTKIANTTEEKRYILKDSSSSQTPDTKLSKFVQSNWWLMKKASADTAMTLAALEGLDLDKKGANFENFNFILSEENLESNPTIYTRCKWVNGTEPPPITPDQIKDPKQKNENTENGPSPRIPEQIQEQIPDEKKPQQQDRSSSTKLDKKLEHLNKQVEKLVKHKFKKRTRKEKNNIREMIVKLNKKLQDKNKENETIKDLEQQLDQIKNENKKIRQSKSTFSFRSKKSDEKEACFKGKYLGPIIRALDDTLDDIVKEKVAEAQENKSLEMKRKLKELSNNIQKNTHSGLLSRLGTHIGSVVSYVCGNRSTNPNELGPKKSEPDTAVINDDEIKKDTDVNEVEKKLAGLLKTKDGIDENYAILIALSAKRILQTANPEGQVQIVPNDNGFELKINMKTLGSTAEFIYSNLGKPLIPSKEVITATNKASDGTDEFCFNIVTNNENNFNFLDNPNLDETLSHNINSICHFEFKKNSRKIETLNPNSEEVESFANNIKAAINSVSTPAYIALKVALQISSSIVKDVLKGTIKKLPSTTHIYDEHFFLGKDRKLQAVQLNTEKEYTSYTKEGELESTDQKLRGKIYKNLAILGYSNLNSDRTKKLSSDTFNSLGTPIEKGNLSSKQGASVLKDVVMCAPKQDSKDKSSVPDDIPENLRAEAKKLKVTFFTERKPASPDLKATPLVKPPK